MNYEVEIYNYSIKGNYSTPKKLRVIAMRYNKLEQKYASIISLVFTIMWLPMHTE